MNKQLEHDSLSHRRLRCASLTLLCSMVLAACGGGGGGGAEPSVPVASTPAPAPAPAPELTLMGGKIDNRYGNFDGSGSQARFGEILGFAKDPSGTLYVLDRLHQSIRKITADGTVSTHLDLVGSLLLPGWSPPTPGIPGEDLKDATRGNYVGGLHAFAIGQTSNFYFVHPQLGIRRVSPSGGVSTVSTPNEINFPGFGESILGVDGDEVLYWSRGRSVRKTFPDGRVEVLAGGVDGLVGGSVDGRGESARFVDISEMLVSLDGTVYVCDDRAVIRKISINGDVTSLAGAPRVDYSTWPAVDGQGRDARFSKVSAMALGSDGSVFVADLFPKDGPPEGSRIRKISPSGQVTTLFTQQTFPPAYGMQVNTDGSFYLTHPYHVSHVDAAGNTKVLAGSSDYSAPAVVNGPLAAASFADPIQVRVGSAGTAYVLENLGLLRPVSADGFVSAQALTPPSFEDLVYFKDFDRSSRWRLGGVDAEGQLYFSVAYRWAVFLVGVVNVANVVAKRSPTGLVSTLWSERFNSRGPEHRTVAGLSADRAGTLLVSFDRGPQQRLSNSGQSLGEPTLPGLAGAKVFKAQGSGGWLAYGCSVQPDACWIRTLGSSGEILSSAPFVPPPSCNGSCVVSDLAQDAKGNTYLTVPTSHRVFKVSSSGEASTFLGKAGSVGITLGPAPASLHTPKSIDIDSNGMMYLVSDRALLKLQLPN